MWNDTRASHLKIYMAVVGLASRQIYHKIPSSFHVLCLLLFFGGVECTVELYVQGERVECSILLIGKLD